MGGRKNPRQLEKLVSYILGRRPDEFGLVLDEEGYIFLRDLVRAISEEPGWGYVRKSHINEILMTSREPPFVIENEKIRAVNRDDALRFREDILVPGLLYHCVRRKAYPVVCRQGILPLGQSRVFLATTQDLACRMGKRREPAPILLNVQARKASEAGVRFLRHGEFIYVTDHIPVGYFTGPPLPEERKKEASVSKREPVAVPKGLPGSFTLDVKRSQSLQRQALKRKGLKKEVAWKRDVRSLRRKAKR